MELTPRTFPARIFHRKIQTTAGSALRSDAALREVDTTGGLGDVFGFGAGVFSAVEGADGVYFAYCFALSVEFKPGADIREFAAGTATEALAPAGF